MARPKKTQHKTGNGATVGCDTQLRQTGAAASTCLTSGQRRDTISRFICSPRDMPKGLMRGYSFRRPIP